jgi:hypothetical protein
MSVPNRLTAALALALIAVPAGAWDLDCQHSAERELRLDTAGASRIEIAARAGDLDVRAGTASQVTARGRACASSAEFLEQTQIRSVRDGGTLKVFVQVPDEMKGIGLFYARLDLQVDVPAGVPVEVIDSSGDSTITGVQLTRLTDSSGDTTLRGITGDFEIHDSSGDLRIDNAVGKVTITDSSGDIVIRGAKDVVVRSDSSGDVDVARVAGSVLIENDSSGDIDVTDVGRDVAVLADTSGAVRVSGVKGTVSVPH